MGSVTTRQSPVNFMEAPYRGELGGEGIGRTENGERRTEGAPLAPQRTERAGAKRQTFHGYRAPLRGDGVAEGLPVSGTADFADLEQIKGVLPHAGLPVLMNGERNAPAGLSRRTTKDHEEARRRSDGSLGLARRAYARSVFRSPFSGAAKAAPPVLCSLILQERRS